MAATPSNMTPLGSPCPDFSLPDAVGGNTVSRDDFKGRPLLVMFICNHCPFVKHIRAELAQLGRDFEARLGIVAISANDIENYPDDSPEKMKIEAAEAGYTFPYLFDETQEIAHAFKAACTPDFFLYNADHKLAYRGQLDDSRPKNSEPVSGRDLRAAIKAVLEGRTPDENQTPSIGCNIKWKKGNEPKG